MGITLLTLFITGIIGYPGTIGAGKELRKRQWVSNGQLEILGCIGGADSG